MLHALVTLNARIQLFQSANLLEIPVKNATKILTAQFLPILFVTIIINAKRGAMKSHNVRLFHLCFVTTTTMNALLDASTT